MPGLERDRPNAVLGRRCPDDREIGYGGAATVNRRPAAVALFTVLIGGRPR